MGSTAGMWTATRSGYQLRTTLRKLPRAAMTTCTRSSGPRAGISEMNRCGNWTVALGCLLVPVGIVSAKVAILDDVVPPALVNPSFEDPGNAPDRAAGWGRWGQWMNREEGW